MTATAPTLSRQDQALARAAEARRLRAEDPEMTLEAIGEAVGVSKQRVQQLLKDPPVETAERWPDDVLAAMCAALEAGKTPQDLLEVPGVAERIAVRRPSRSAREQEGEQDKRRLSSLRKLICVGKNQPEGSPGRKLYEARQAGLDTSLRGWSEGVFKATEKALKGGAKYAAVLVAVPELAKYLGADGPRAATMLRVIVESGEDRPVGTRGRRLFDARQA